ncbi:unnamed protein product [Lactuca saligna]|uniref:Uncharacterized protein n=1 Tax=Lactuca saligna TaxID=75948 RepID=A0AA35YD50_LACSI|nr:unnamed protein product [Lactuca saligna]
MDHLPNPFLLLFSITTAPPSSFLVFPIEISKKEASEGHRTSPQFLHRNTGKTKKNEGSSTELPPPSTPRRSSQPPPAPPVFTAAPPLRRTGGFPPVYESDTQTCMRFCHMQSPKKLDLSRKSRPLGNTSRLSELLVNHSIRKSVKCRAHSDDGKHGTQVL